MPNCTRKHGIYQFTAILIIIYTIIKTTRLSVTQAMWVTGWPSGR